MTDQGRGYGSQPWNPADSGHGEPPQQPVGPDGQGYVPQGQYVQQPLPQYQQGQYGQGRYVPQGQYVQPGQPGQFMQQQGQPGPYEQQQWQQPQQGYPQQGQPGQGQQGQQVYQQQQPAFPQQQQPQQHQQFAQPQAPQQQYVQAPMQAAPVAPQPSGPGPDGIDWEAEAAALDNPQPVEAFQPQESYQDELYVEDGEHLSHEELAEEEYTEDDYVEGEPGEESFFGEQDDSREAERQRKVKGKKSGRRNSGACLVVALVLLGGMGGAGYWGYGFYQKNFGPPADYSGSGSGSVQIEIKPDSTGGAMAKVLLDAGVVKSLGAFNNAYSKNPKAITIQPGYYSMQLQMSGDAAVQLLVSAAGGDALIVPEGQPASAVYALIDGKLKLDKGTTAGVAKTQAGNLGLPAFAGNNPEGFLWPTKYSISQGMKPEELLKQMVANAVSNYQTLGLDAGAQKIGLKSAYEVITEASILQREGNNSQDFGKMARVIYNRLNSDVTHHTLGMDTTLEYSVGSKTLTKAQINDGSNKYNTYINPGLPPSPISNPGAEAIKAVLDPTPGTWAYFIAMSPTETRFSTSPDEFKANVKENCTAHGQGFDAASTTCK